MDRSALEHSLLARLERPAGPLGTSAASSLLMLARELGTDIGPGDPSWSFGVAGAPERSTKRVTLFLLSTRGTFWVRWLERWEKAGVDPRVAVQYQQRLESLLGPNVMGRQMHTEKAIGLRTVHKHLPEIQAVLRDAVEAMRTTGAGGALG